MNCPHLPISLSFWVELVGPLEMVVVSHQPLWPCCLLPLLARPCLGGPCKLKLGLGTTIMLDKVICTIFFTNLRQHRPLAAFFNILLRTQEISNLFHQITFRYVHHHSLRTSYLEAVVLCYGSGSGSRYGPISLM